jgi:iron complex transport system substrate-binding protein
MGTASTRDNSRPARSSNGAFSNAVRLHRSGAVSLALALAVAAAAVAIDRFASIEGGLRMTREGNGYGRPEIRTGPVEYPRQAIDSDRFTVRLARPVRRIASQYWSLDEYLYSVVPPERVIAVSQLSYEPRISNVSRYLEQFKPVIASDPERVVRERPDLMLVSNSARIDFCDLVRGAGVPVYRAFTMFETLDQVAATIRLIGYLTGEDLTAENETERFWSSIRRAESRRPVGALPPRILGIGGRNTYGDGTLFHDIVKRLGAINVAAEGGLHGYETVNGERIVRWNPEWIIAGADRGASAQVLARLLDDAAIATTQAARSGRIVVLDNNVFLPMSPYTALLVNAIAEVIYE